MLTEEDKYRFYEAAVQSPDFDIDFFDDYFSKVRNRLPKSFREDFGGTGLNSKEFVSRRKDNVAYVVDLDPSPLKYGREHHLTALPKKDQERLHYVEQNVLKDHPKSYPAFDVVAALNFSYFIFKERETLKSYFKKVFKSLSSDGLFFLDIFGGSQCQGPIEDVNDRGEFLYYWDCDEFNPITHDCVYKIHFRPKGQKRKIKDVFVYNWRHWTIPEVMDVLKEAGFKHMQILWEGDDEDGGGNGEFCPTWEIENCDAWVSYIVASKADLPGPQNQRMLQ